MAEETQVRHHRNFSEDDELAEVRAAIADSRQGFDVQGETVDLNIEPSIGSIDELGFDDLLEASLRHTESQNTSPQGDFDFDPAIFDDDQAMPLPAPDEQPQLDPESAQTTASAPDSVEDDPFAFKGLADLDDGVGPQFGDSQKPADSVPGPEFEDELTEALQDARAKQPSHQLGQDPLNGMAPGSHLNPAGHDAGRVEVGLLQGMSLLGGAGLAALAHLIRNGGAAANNAMQQHRYNKITSEVNGHTQQIEDVVGMLNGNGLSSGLHGLKGAHRDEFVQEFLEEPANRDLFNKLLSSVGALSTSTSKAAVVGSGAGLSPEQIESDIQNRISDVRDRHKEVLEALKDQSGKSVADRLNSVISQLADLIKSIFRRATQTLGIGPRPGM
ncbi:hypothetical protein [Pseudomonas sp. EMN2]|uniref:hypothetical protein n=1 Tax=Pseudomonas sp. EMN2 TaxID=2615212 RepID=UPI00129BD17A|nr:hypothetical protein [Pseudomonas sp. EMN2]